MRYGLRRKGETICSLCASPLKEDHPLDEVLPRVLRDKNKTTGAKNQVSLANKSGFFPT